MPRGFSVVAIIAAYNEADIISASVRDLIDQDISVYLLDDGSTDGTVQAVEPYVGRGVIGIEHLRPPEADAGEFTLKQIVRRKAQLATALDADWFINHDADEFRESPWGDVPLKEAIRRVDALGYNAIDFASLDFLPTDERSCSSEDVRVAFPFYSEAASYDRVQIRCWKRTAGVELESTGGHDTRFDERRVFPIRFISRHYPIRGQAHGERKVFVERRPRYAGQEQALGWHVQYEHLAEGASFIHDRDTLTRFDPVDVRIGLSVRHRGVEELEQLVDRARKELQSAQSDVEARTRDFERSQRDLNDARSTLAARSSELVDANQQIKSLDAELTEIRGELGHRVNELAACRDQIAGLSNALQHRKAELDAFRRSLSWRWTAPARAVYRLLTGR